MIAAAAPSHRPAPGKPGAHGRIVQVLHGADSDIAWLQRDFGLYIVNLFDTGQVRLW